MPIDSALHKACHNGKINEVIALLQSGEHDVNEVGAGKYDRSILNTNLRFCLR